MGQADQFPFAFHLFKASQEKTPNASGSFDLSKYWFNGLFPLGIDLSCFFCFQFIKHPVHDTCIGRKSYLRQEEFNIRMFDTVFGDKRINIVAFSVTYIGLAEKP